MSFDMKYINPRLDEFIFVPYARKHNDMYIAMSTYVYHIRIMKGCKVNTKIVKG
jgi:hypothetical protein